MVAMIKELLETRIRPAVQEDGGDIQFQACLPLLAWQAATIRTLSKGCCSYYPFIVLMLAASIALFNGVQKQIAGGLSGDLCA